MGGRSRRRRGRGREYLRRARTKSHSDHGSRVGTSVTSKWLTRWPAEPSYGDGPPCGQEVRVGVIRCDSAAPTRRGRYAEDAHGRLPLPLPPPPSSPPPALHQPRRPRRLPCQPRGGATAVWPRVPPRCPPVPMGCIGLGSPRGQPPPALPPRRQPRPRVRRLRHLLMKQQERRGDPRVGDG